MLTLLVLAGLLIGQILLWAAVLAILARRSSSVRLTMARSLASVVLCTVFNLLTLWLLNPAAEGLAPIAVLVRSLLILALMALGNVRIVQFVLKTTYGHAWYLWILSMMITSAIAYGIVYLVLKPYVAEAYVNSSSAMSPTILGWHRIDECPLCGGRRILPAADPNSEQAKLDDREPEPPGICAKCRKITRYEGEIKTLKSLPVDAPDRILVNKLLVPKRWDLVVIKMPGHPEANVIKRLVGLPGETVVLKEGDLWVDGVRLEPPAEIAGIEFGSMRDGPADPMGTPKRPWKLGPGECVVLGDFRDRSADSRMWGPLPMTAIETVVGLTYWPPARWKIHR